MSDTSAAMADPIKKLGKNWGWFLVYGLLLLALGLLSLFQPREMTSTLALIFGIAIVIAGVFDIVAAIASDEEGLRWPGILMGIIAIVLGFVVIRHREAAIAVVGLILGAYWLIRGIVMMVTGITGHEVPGRIWRILGGLVFTVLGAYVLGFPTTGPAVVVWILGLLLVAAGLLEIIMSFAIRSAAKQA